MGLHFEPPARTRRESFLGLWCPAFRRWIPAVCAGLLMLGVGPAAWAFQADLDADSDGLPDTLENLLGTSALLTDTDGDGFPDGVEHFLYADPLDNTEVPNAALPGFRLSFYTSGSILQFHYGFYSPFGVSDLQDFRMAWSILPSGQGAGVSFDLTTAMLPATNWGWTGTFQGATVISFTQGLVQNSLQRFSPFGVGGVAKFQNGGSPLTLLQTDDIIDIQNGYGVVFSSGQSQQGGGGIGMPLDPSFPPPPGWNQDQACVTSLMPVSTANGAITYEVTSASCQGYTGGACSPVGCSAKAGTAVTTVDPVWLAGLVGG